MQLIDYTHPDEVPGLFLPLDRRNVSFYQRLDQLPKTNEFYSHKWALFRSVEWLEGGSAWLQAKNIYTDMCETAEKMGLSLNDLRPVVGSDNPDYDEGLAQALSLYGTQPLIAEVTPRHADASRPISIQRSE